MMSGMTGGAECSYRDGPGGSDRPTQHDLAHKHVSRNSVAAVIANVRVE